MTHSVRPAVQVIEFVRRLAPEQRRAVKSALKESAHGRCDIRALEGSLSGNYRLRVGRHRVIFNYADTGAIEATFIEDRNLVYDVFEAEFIKKLRT
jgi:mRNA interferase RelE/StbE